MNKKSELIGLSIVLLLAIIAGIFLYHDEVKNKQYIGDSNTMTVYKLGSTNENCLIQNLRISPTNAKLFETLEQAENEGFSLNESCD